MPTFVHGKGTQVLFNQYDLSSYFAEASPASTVETADTTAFGNNSRAYIVGLMDGTIAAKGMFEGSAGGVDADLSAIIGAAGPQVITVIPAGLPGSGQTVGQRAISAQVHDTKYEIGAPVGDKVSVQAEFQSTSGLVHGVILQPYVSLVGTTTGASVDNAAASNFGGLGFLHIVTNTLTGVPTLITQSSPDNASWSTFLTWTIAAGAASSQTQTVAASTGSVPRYLRSLFTLGTGGAVTMLHGFTRYND